ncbi:MAG: biopolymer transporter ExbD [bacterium]|nr:biopolymer transporter ExbD [bacterium]
MKRDFSLNPTSRVRRSRRNIEIAMTPMIDIIFLLLVFFLATASFQVVEKLLPSGVSETTQPTGSLDAVVDPSDDALEQVIVKLILQENSTSVQLNGIALPTFDDLRARLQGIALAGADVPVIIDPEESVIASSVIQAYDWAREAGLTRVYLATRP